MPMFNDLTFNLAPEAAKRSARHDIFTPAPAGVPLLEAPPDACRWPCEDILQCCGAEATHGVYCAEHARRAYRRHLNTIPGGAGNDIYRAAVTRHNIPQVIVLALPALEDIL